MTWSCEESLVHVDALVDDALDLRTIKDFEAHLERCGHCREVVDGERAFRVFLRESVEDDPGVCTTPSLRARVEERCARRLFLDRAWRQNRWLAAAAAVLVAWLGYQEWRADHQRSTIARALEIHAAQLPADVDVRNQNRPEVPVANYFDNKVGFRVRPARLGRQAQLVGARYSPFQEQGAAALYYDVKGNRVTVVVLDGAIETGEKVQMGKQELRMVRIGDRIVPVRQERGLSYAFIGDLKRQELLKLAAGAQVKVE